jgi:colanic acid/amylovoran biosynthesis glycosyltransferase
MLTVAYLANQFPSEVEPYVGQEIEELRARRVEVVCGSVRKPEGEIPDIVVQNAGAGVLARAIWLCLTHFRSLVPLLASIFTSGHESFAQQFKALLHTLLGAVYAVLLRGREVDHIHVHHGYFASWIGLTAARLLKIGFSMTLHGSDLLLNGRYLEIKLANCDFCITISEYNRNYILQNFPGVDAQNIVVSRLGVDLPERTFTPTWRTEKEPLQLLAVGRLHEVKNHGFLLRACADLMKRGIRFHCRIAGEGPERRNLESSIQDLDLQDHVTLLGHVARESLNRLYDEADLVVLTSRSEGIPLVLMEAMARGRIVLAPAITGIRELITSGESGFLYEPGSLADFVAHLETVDALTRVGAQGQSEAAISVDADPPLAAIRRAATAHIRQNFNRKKNLECFADLFLERVSSRGENSGDANLILQQI